MNKKCILSIIMFFCFGMIVLASAEIRIAFSLQGEKLEEFYDTLEEPSSYLMQPTESIKLPFRCEINNNKLMCNGNHNFNRTAPINKDEYLITGQTNTYLRPITSYWTMTEENSNAYEIKSTGVSSIAKDSTSGIRASVYIKKATRVKGAGTIRNPFEFIENTIDYVGLPEGEYGDGDEVTYGGDDWLVVSDNGDTVTLISAKNVKDRSIYGASNEWSTSYVKGYLNDGEGIDDSWLDADEDSFYRGEINNGGIIFDESSGTYVRMIRKEELFPALYNRSNTNFWTMTTEADSVWYSRKNIAFTYTTLSSGTGQTCYSGSSTTLSSITSNSQNLVTTTTNNTLREPTYFDSRIDYTSTLAERTCYTTYTSTNTYNYRCSKTGTLYPTQAAANSACAAVSGYYCASNGGSCRATNAEAQSDCVTGYSCEGSYGWANGTTLESACSGACANTTSYYRNQGYYGTCSLRSVYASGALLSCTCTCPAYGNWPGINPNFGCVYSYGSIGTCTYQAAGTVTAQIMSTTYTASGTTFYGKSYTINENKSDNGVRAVITVRENPNL